MSEPTDPTTSTEPMQERAPDIAQLMRDVHDFGVSAKAKTHAAVAERMFDAMCCGTKAADLPFLATDRPMTLALIDLLFAKIADTREADAIEAAGEPEAPAKININTQVWVRLTDHGVEVARRADFLIYDATLQRGREPCAGEWIRNEIWVLMHAFGAAAFGGRQVFVANEFVLTDPTKPR